MPEGGKPLQWGLWLVMAPLILTDFIVASWTLQSPHRTIGRLYLAALPPA